MVFSSPTFLFAFLPLTLLVLAVARHRGFQNSWLLLMSALFYIWGAGAAVLVLLYVTAVSYLFGLVPWARLRARASKAAYRAVLGLGLLAVLSPLLFYKYIPPLARIVADDFFLGSVVLPLGISFFTFHALSYIVDVAKGTIEHERNVRDYALYLFVFPHQIAGPIVRYAEIRPELRGFRDASLPQLGFGLTRFSWGLAKKVVVADPCGRLADGIFLQNAQTGDLSAADAWLGALLYAFQIYFDFSGYSDMAIGLALMLGFHFPENFVQPYRSVSVTDFWRRWHITLSRWFRDYVYIPMGGNRHGPARENIALLTVFLLTALWHGAALTFLIWGGLHSAVLLIERYTGIRSSARFLTARRVLMIVFIVVSWVPFRAGSVSELGTFWRSMATGSFLEFSPGTITGFTPFLLVAMAIGIASLIGRRDHTGFGMVFGTRSSVDLSAFRWRLAVPLTVGLLLVSFVSILWSDFSPFLYFQF